VKGEGGRGGEWWREEGRKRGMEGGEEGEEPVM